MSIKVGTKVSITNTMAVGTIIKRKGDDYTIVVDECADGYYMVGEKVGLQAWRIKPL